jgi:hypothetical protein
LYIILIEFGVPMKLVRLIKMCSNEICSKVRIGKHLSDTFPYAYADDVNLLEDNINTIKEIQKL